MSIHPRILADTLNIVSTQNAHIRLMNDSRWPWVLLIPVQADIQELHDLSDSQRNHFMADVNRVSRVVQHITGCHSVNIAMLGNIVTQLHCHVVARDEGDPNWPNPVWGQGSATPYSDGQADELMRALRESF